MAKNTTAPPEKPYSETLDDADLRRKAQSVQDGGLTGFHTAAFQKMGTTEWREACRDDAGRWRVIQYNRYDNLPGGEPDKPQGALNNNNVVLYGACFLDALYSCAGFEMREKETGALTAADTPFTAAAGTSLQEAANTARVPLDADNMPLLAAYGQVMTDGAFFDDEARARAAESAAASPAAAPPPPVVDTGADVRDFLRTVETNKAPDPDEFLPASQDGVALQHTFEQVAKSAHSIDEIMQYAVNSDDPFKSEAFSDGPSAILCALATTVTLGYVLYGFRKNFFPNTVYDSRIKKLNEQIKPLPEGEIKSLLQDFAKSASGAWKLEKARSFLYGKEGFDKTLPSETVAEGLALIQSAGVDYNLSAAETANLRAAYVNGKFPDRDYFHSKLPPKLETIDRKIKTLSYAPTAG